MYIELQVTKDVAAMYPIDIPTTRRKLLWSARSSSLPIENIPAPNANTLVEIKM
jgi:hypothetical protein